MRWYETSGRLKIRIGSVDHTRWVILTTSGVIALTIERGRIMCAIEEFCEKDRMGHNMQFDRHIRTNQLSIGNLARVKFYTDCFSMVCGTIANKLVSGVGNDRVSSCISNLGGENSFVLGGREVLQKYMFYAPETTSSEGSNFWFHG